MRREVPMAHRPETPGALERARLTGNVAQGLAWWDPWTPRFERSTCRTTARCQDTPKCLDRNQGFNEGTGRVGALAWARAPLHRTARNNPLPRWSERTPGKHGSGGRI